MMSECQIQVYCLSYENMLTIQASAFLVSLIWIYSVINPYNAENERCPDS